MSSDEKVVADPAATIPRKVMPLRGPELVQDFQAIVQGYIGRRGGTRRSGAASAQAKRALPSRRFAARGVGGRGSRKRRSVDAVLDRSLATVGPRLAQARRH